MLLFTVVLAMPCCRQTPSVGVACPHSRVYLRTEATQGRRSAQWEFSYQGNGRYVLYDKDVNGEIIIDVASASQCAHHVWGGNMTTQRIVPGEPYSLDNHWWRQVQCGYRTLHCDSIVLEMNQETDAAQLTLCSSRGSSPLVRLMLPDSSKSMALPQKLPYNGKREVLALGNSLTIFNHQDSMFNAIARSVGVDARWVNHCHGYASLQSLWDEGMFISPNGHISARGELLLHRWTHIVLQEYSLKPLYQPDEFAASVHQWVEFVRHQSINRDAEILLIVNWPYALLWDDYEEVAGIIEHNCRAVARREGIRVVPIGVAYHCAYSSGGAGAVQALYADDRHPSFAGSYLAACMEIAQITGIATEYVRWQPAAIDDATGLYIRQLVSEVVR